MIERLRNDIELGVTDDIRYARKFDSEDTVRAVEDLICDATSMAVETFYSDDEDGWFVMVSDYYLA